MIRRGARLPHAASWVSGAAVLALGAWLSLSGCIGGTSTEVPNPLNLDIRRDGRPFESDVYLRVVKAGSNPEFYYDDQAEDPAGAPILRIGGLDLGPSDILVIGGGEFSIFRDEIAAALAPRERLPLSKAAAGLRRNSGKNDLLHPFNLMISASGPAGERLLAWLPDLEDQGDGLGYRSSTGDSGSAFVLDLEPGRRCTGEVDTTSAVGAPLALFVPGSAFYSQVREGRFEFKDLPGGRLPLRWVSADGRVYSVPESLGVAGDGPTPAEYELPGPVHAGERIDSIAMPDPPPALSAPTAEPAGPHVFSDSVVVALSAPSGSTVYYTLDGSAPKRDSGVKYERPVVIGSSATLRAIAYASGYLPSPVAVNNYLLSPARPTFSPAAAEYRDSVRVRIKGPAGAVVRYTLDGNDPDGGSPVYSAPVVLRASATVKAVAVVPGLGSSAVASAAYEIVSDSAAAAP